MVKVYQGNGHGFLALGTIKSEKVPFILPKIPHIWSNELNKACGYNPTYSYFGVGLDTMYGIKLHDATLFV